MVAPFTDLRDGDAENFIYLVLSLRMDIVLKLIMEQQRVRMLIVDNWLRRGRSF